MFCFFTVVFKKLGMVKEVNKDAKLTRDRLWWLISIKLAKLELYFSEFYLMIRSDFICIVRDFSHEIGKADERRGCILFKHR